MQVYRWECIKADQSGKKTCGKCSHRWSPHRDLVVRKALDHERRTGHKTIVWGHTRRKLGPGDADA